jgi:hypothetical protein
MAQFPVRIELHEAKWPEDYNKLHGFMGNSGFSKTIKDTKGILFELPTAEYYKVSTNTIQTEEKAASKAATLVGKKFGIVIAECSGILVDGLIPVKK